MLYRVAVASRSCLVPVNVATISRFFGVSSVRAKWGERYIPEKDLDQCPPDFKEFPERDLVNYPRPKRYVFPPKARLGFIPDSFFNFMYSKTGVTGPYMLGLGVLAFLINKEMYILMDENSYVIAFILGQYSLYKVFAKPLGKYIYNDHNNYRTILGQRMRAFQDNVKTRFDESKDLVSRCDGLTDMLFQAQRDQVLMQMEVEYRKRLLEYKSAVKRKLDYLVDIDEAKKRFQRRHIVDWVVDQVRRSIDDQVQKAAFAQCLLNLKTLSTTAKI